MGRIGSFTNALVMGHVAGFVLTQMMGLGGQLALLPPPFLWQRPWTLLTWPFVMPFGILGVLFFLLILWYFGNAVEGAMGTGRYVAMWATSNGLAAVVSMAAGTQLYGPFAFEGALLVVFARLFPDATLFLMFVLPAKGRVLAIVGGGLVLWTAFASHSTAGGIAHAAGMAAGYLVFQFTAHLPSRRKLAFELKNRRAQAIARVENVAVEQRNVAWDPRVREAENRARAAGRVAAEDDELLGELDAAVDPSITVCAPSEFGYTDDDVCRSCAGFAECAARRIRMAAEESDEDGESTERASTG
jgi:membrane associated rhomboid family serine protease